MDNRHYFSVLRHTNHFRFIGGEQARMELGADVHPHAPTGMKKAPAAPFS
jgi:hypothetical protein